MAAVFDARRPTAAQRRFNALCRSAQGFLRGALKPQDAAELQHAAALTLMAWPMLAATDLASRMFGSSFSNVLDTAPLTSQGTAPVAGAEAVRAIQEASANTAKRSLRELERVVGHQWIAQCGAEFADVVEVKAEGVAKPVQVLVTECNLAIHRPGNKAQVKASVYGFCSAGSYLNGALCDPLTPPKLVSRCDDPRLHQGLWSMVMHLGAERAHMVTNVRLRRLLHEGWAPSTREAVVAENARYRPALRAKSWLDLDEERLSVLERTTQLRGSSLGASKRTA